MKVSIDPDLCQGHAVCYLVAPKVFDVDEDGRGMVISQEIPEELEADAKVAAHRCPESAVILS